VNRRADIQSVCGPPRKRRREAVLCNDLLAFRFRAAIAGDEWELWRARGLRSNAEKSLRKVHFIVDGNNSVSEYRRMNKPTIHIAGDKVKGSYYGKPYTGTVVRNRQLTVRPYNESYVVQFDIPVQPDFAATPREVGCFDDGAEAEMLGCTIHAA
jgi:hypothetical protein